MLHREYLASSMQLAHGLRFLANSGWPACPSHSLPVSFHLSGVSDSKGWSTFQCCPKPAGGKCLSGKCLPLALAASLEKCLQQFDAIVISQEWFVDFYFHLFSPVITFKWIWKKNWVYNKLGTLQKWERKPWSFTSGGWKTKLHINKGVGPETLSASENFRQHISSSSQESPGFIDGHWDSWPHGILARINTQNTCWHRSDPAT